MKKITISTVAISLLEGALACISHKRSTAEAQLANLLQLFARIDLDGFSQACANAIQNCSYSLSACPVGALGEFRDCHQVGGGSEADAATRGDCAVNGNQIYRHTSCVWRRRYATALG